MRTELRTASLSKNDAKVRQFADTVQGIAAVADNTLRFKGFYGISITYFSQIYRTATGGRRCCLGDIPMASKASRSEISQRRKVSVETPAAMASSYLYMDL